MDIVTGALFGGSVVIFIITLLVNHISKDNMLILQILSFGACIMAIAAALNDPVLLTNDSAHGDIILLSLSLIGLLHIPGLLKAVGVDEE